MDLFFTYHQFECLKLYDHWRLVRLLISGSRGIGQDIRKLSRTPTIKKKKKKLWAAITDFELAWDLWNTTSYYRIRLYPGGDSSHKTS